MLATTGPDEDAADDEGAVVDATAAAAVGGACWGCTGALLTGGFLGGSARKAICLSG